METNPDTTSRNTACCPKRPANHTTSTYGGWIPHGGWIASAADVARFMARIDRNPAVGGYNTRLARVSVLFRVRALDTYRLPARHGGRNDTHRRQVFIRAALKQTLLRRTILGRPVPNARPCHNRPLNPYTRNRPPPLDRYTMIIHGGMHRVHNIYKKQIFPSLTIIISDKK